MNSIQQQLPDNCTAEFDEGICTNFRVTFTTNATDDIVDVACLVHASSSDPVSWVTNLTGQTAPIPIRLHTVETIEQPAMVLPAVVQRALSVGCLFPQSASMVVAVTRNGVNILLRWRSTDLGGQIGSPVSAHLADGTVLYCFGSGPLWSGLAGCGAKGGPAPAT